MNLEGYRMADRELIAAILTVGTLAKTDSAEFVVARYQQMLAALAKAADETAKHYEALARRGLKP
jgi:hypothetical protein